MSKPSRDLWEASAEFLRLLAHPMRLAILDRLRHGELSVAGFEAELGLRQPSLSQQLGLLREAGLVASSRQAKSIIYRLNDDRVSVMLDPLRTLPPSARPSPGPSDAGSPAPPRRSAARPTTARTPGKPVADEAGRFAAAGPGLRLRIPAFAGRS